MLTVASGSTIGFRNKLSYKHIVGADFLKLTD